jgi:hypothetical protein
MQLVWDILKANVLVIDNTSVKKDCGLKSFFEY